MTTDYQQSANVASIGSGLNKANLAQKFTSNVIKNNVLIIIFFLDFKLHHVHNREQHNFKLRHGRRILQAVGTASSGTFQHIFLRVGAWHLGQCNGHNNDMHHKTPADLKQLFYREPRRR